MEERFAALENRVAQLEAQALVDKAKTTFDATEDLFDLEMKKPPRYEGDWPKDEFGNFLTIRCSKATKDQCLAVAKYRDWMAKKSDESNETDDKGRPKSFYPRRDAVTIRKWAARK